MVAAAEAIPSELAGRVDELTIQFPWASLLRGTLALDDAVARGIATLLTPGGRVTALVAPSARDNLGPGVPTADRIDREALATAWCRYGLTLTELRPAATDEVRASRSSWARRLGPGRAVVRLTLDRAGTADGCPSRTPSGR